MHCFPKLIYKYINLITEYKNIDIFLKISKIAERRQNCTIKRDKIVF